MDNRRFKAVKLWFGKAMLALLWLPLPLSAQSYHLQENHFPETAVAMPAHDGILVAGRAGTLAKDPERVYWFSRDKTGAQTNLEIVESETALDFSNILPLPDGEAMIFAVEKRDKDPYWQPLLIRLDKSHRETWRRSVESLLLNRRYRAYPDASGGFLLLGEFGDTAHYHCDLFLAKINNQAEVQWRYYYGDKNDEYGHSIYQFPDASFLVGGNINLIDTANGGGWLFRTDASGNVRWKRRYPFTDILYPDLILPLNKNRFCVIGGHVKGKFRCMTIDGDGKILARTEYKGRLYPDNYRVGTPAINLPDGGFVILYHVEKFGSENITVRLLRLDAGGKEVWNRKISNGNPAMFYSISPSGDGGFALAGVREDSNVPPGAIRDPEVLLLWLDATGRVVNQE